MSRLYREIIELGKRLVVSVKGGGQFLGQITPHIRGSPIGFRPRLTRHEDLPSGPGSQGHEEF